MRLLSKDKKNTVHYEAQGKHQPEWTKSAATAVSFHWMRQNYVQELHNE
jgi:hypothetical protein